MSLVVPIHERGVIRLFALSMTDDEAKVLVRDDNADAERLQSAALGIDALDTEYVEVFAVKVLEELGLAGYMIEGNGVPADQVEPDRTKLAALEGWVMVVYSRAFRGAAVTLAPAPELTLIATYHEPGTDWTDPNPLESKAATELTPAKTRPSDGAMMGRVAMVALLDMFALTGLVIWIAG
jgi:hypothetical protein